VRQFFIALAVVACLASFLAVQAADEQPAVTGKRIPELIEQLGATEYATREKAQAELANLGLDAFEALFEAQHHRDLEIATRARFLIRGMNVRFYKDGDPAEVKRLLRNYNEGSIDQRRPLIDKLLSIQDPAVLPVICRLVRYESDLMLSKYAAVGLMAREPKLNDAERAERAAAIRAATVQGKRAATAWLRTYATTLEDPAAAIPKWRELIAEEIDLRERASDQTSEKICIDLLRYEVGLLKKLGQQEQANAEIDRVIALTGKSPQLPQMEELTGWLVAQEAWDKVLQFYGAQQETFAESPPLLYRVAQAQRKLNREDEAKVTAKQALGIKPESYEEHLITAIKLKESGLFDWAQQEFELVSKTTPAGSAHDIPPGCSFRRCCTIRPRSSLPRRRCKSCRTSSKRTTRRPNLPRRFAAISARFLPACITFIRCTMPRRGMSKSKPKSSTRRSTRVPPTRMC